MIPFGTRVKDNITGFEGKVMAYTVYMNGCVRYLVEAKATVGNNGVEAWIDEQRLTVKSEATAGGQRAAPRGMPIPPKL